MDFLNKVLTIEPPTKKKRFVGKPDFSTCNKGQCVAVRKFRTFLAQEEISYFLLEGWAGTGKTFLTSLLIEDVLFNTLGKTKIAMTAPINKAVRVLKNSASFYDDRLVYGTLHSLLGLKANIDKNTGQLKFSRDYNTECMLDECNYLVIDEASMLSDELFTMIDTFYVQNKQLKVIFVGDGGQIPPIGQDYAIPFNIHNKELLAQYKMIRHELTEIVRQVKAHPIIPFSTKLRRNINKPNPIVLFNDILNDQGQGVIFLGGRKQTELGKAIRTLFTSPNFKVNADFAKIICWRNKYVASFNKLVRSMLFGTNIPKIVEGEKMIATKAVLQGMDVFVMANSTEFEVLELDEKIMIFEGGNTCQYYECEVKCIDFEEDSIKTIQVIHEDSELWFKQTLNHLYEAAKGEPDGNARMKLWNKYWKLKKTFAEVDYNYAITAHRSQGSTYQYALVVMEDIYSQHRNIAVQDRNRIGYTACTRAKEMLILVGDL